MKCDVFTCPCIPASQGSSGTTNENGYIAENSGEKNSENKKKNPKTSACLEMGELPSSSNKRKFS